MGRRYHTFLRRPAFYMIAPLVATERRRPRAAAEVWHGSYHCVQRSRSEVDQAREGGAQTRALRSPGAFHRQHAAHHKFPPIKPQSSWTY